MLPTATSTPPWDPTVTVLVASISPVTFAVSGSALAWISPVKVNPAPKITTVPEASPVEGIFIVNKAIELAPGEKVLLGNITPLYVPVTEIRPGP